MKAAAHRHGELVPLADATGIGGGEHERASRLGVGDGVDAADLRALLVGGDEVFFVLGFHVCLLRVRRGDFLRECADKGIIHQWRWWWGLRCVEWGILFDYFSSI